MRKLAGCGVAIALLVSLLLARPAEALAPSLHVTADSLATWQTNGTVWSLAATQGKVIAGGSFTAVRPPGTPEGSASSVSRSRLVVLDAATGSPTNCVLDVARAGSTAVVRAVVAGPNNDGTVYIGGLFDTVNGAARRNLAAIDLGSCALKTFNPQPNSFVYAIATVGNSVYFGGNFSSVGGQARSRLAAATAAGGVLSWAPTTDDDILALAIDPANGNVIIGGRTNSINGQDSAMLGVVDGLSGTVNVHNYPRGFFPWTPGTGQRAGTSVVKSIAIDGTGFYVGNEGTGGGIFDGRSAFNWGSYTQRWRDNCLGATQAMVPINGVLYAASHSHNCESESTFEDGQRHYFTAETTADKQYQPWWPQANDGIGEGIGPRAMTLAATPAGDYLWAGGEFTQINGVAQRGLARFGRTPDSGAPAVPATPNVSSLAPGQATVTWRSTTDDDDKTLTYTLFRGTSTTPIATLQAESQFYLRPQLSFTDTGLTPGQTYSYRVKASDGTNTSAFSLSRSVTVASTASAYPAAIRADGATVYFRMEEPNGTTAGSLGSSSQGGVYQNASTRVGQAGALLTQAGQSALFDGTSSFLRSEVRAQAPTVYTIETWFKTTTTRGGKLVGYGNRVNLNTASFVPSSGAYDRHIFLTNDGRVIFGVNPGTKVTLSSAPGLNNGQWHQVVASQGPSGMSLYVDGLRIATNTRTGAQSFQGYWRIGGDNLSTWPSRPASDYFAGNIDETAIYPGVLTAAQVANHYRLSGRSMPGDPADGQAPSVPAGLQASVSGSSVNLLWSPSTDNVGVTGYQVHRSSVSGFTANAGTKVADVASGTSFSDVGRPVGTWFYRVVAVDAAGNSSSASTQASAVVSGAAVQTVTLSPTEDTYAVQAQPLANFGSSASMNSRGGSSSFTAYLKFTLPAAPTGTSLVGATLSLRTTTDAAAGSADPHVVSLSSSSWTETGLTWSNRPAVGTTIGSTTAPTVPNTRYDVGLNAPAVAALPAGAVTVTVSSASTDSFQTWSRDFATTSARPTLTLTYQAS